MTKKEQQYKCLYHLPLQVKCFNSSILKAADGFKRLLPNLDVVIGYVTAFYALSLTLMLV
ncbi:hypothetical protein VSK92_05670 [Bacillus swezeyi]|uniref:hypothetical protein n=1 Tax=Bacillus swezeyi TaxID=1925020 RepID=UPI0039C64A92